MELKGKIRPKFQNIALIIAGLIGISVGGDWVTQGAVKFATWAGMSEATIGLTIVAFGTSLPELAASAMAAWKRNFGIALGNIVGSNIFDFLLIFGVAAAMEPIRFSGLLYADLWITAIASVLLFAALAIGKKHVLSRTQGLLFIILYGVYLAYIFLLRPSL